METLTNPEFNGQEKKENSSPNYFVVIPSHVLDDPRVDDATAILFGRIASLTQNVGYCYASDKYLAELTRCSPREVRRRMKTLEKCGYISKETKKKGTLWERKIFSNYNYERTIWSARKDCMVRSKGPYGPKNNIREEQDKKEQMKKDISNDISKKAKPPASDPPPPDANASSSTALEARRLSLLLYKNLKSINPKMKPPKMKAWEGVVEKMLRIDKRTEEEVKKVIKWIFEKSDFWWKTILSTNSLRRNYDAIYTQAFCKKKQKSETTKEEFFNTLR